ncbi:IS3 family transposase [Variovorax sp. JS1663]|uniref:IS3 family transposase n=1 Tax=Variovorax sp. JS1663 TaxID=1851577 RepID=UPI003FD3D90A
MGKYTDKQKLDAVQAYRNGGGGLRATAESQGVSVDSLRKWVAAYAARGTQGVVTKRRSNYDVAFKLDVLRRMAEERISCRQAAALFDIRRLNQVAEWSRLYEAHGAAALRPGWKGEQTRMSKLPRQPKQADVLADDQRSREELLRDLQQLRMENAYLKKGAGLGSSEEALSARERTLIVLELRHRFPLSGLLRCAGLARSSFYYQQKALKAVEKHLDLRERIREIFTHHRGRYGYRRVTAELRRQGLGVNHKTVQKLMVRMQLKSLVRPKRYKAFVGPVAEAAPNHLQRDFEAAQPNEKWVTDVTEFKVNNRKLYLSPVMDLYNREIVSYEIAERPLPTMIESMLTKAFDRLESNERPILHSDQGWHYRMPSFRKRLQRKGLVHSMSRKGNCLDNAAMESFFATLKCELFYVNEFESIEALKGALHDYIRYYNVDRIKMSLSGLSPVEYRQRETQGWP